MLDIGAEHGFFSVAFTRSSEGERRAIAIEPSPVAYPVLVDQLRMNCVDTVVPLNMAVGENAGQIEMAIRGNHAITAFGSYEDLTSERHTIPLQRVDDVCRDYAFEPDLMKVDVEGYELFVLRGAREVLTRFGPLLLLEIHPAQIASLGNTVPELVRFLEECGYAHVHSVTGKPCPLPAAGSEAGIQRVIFRKINVGTLNPIPGLS